MAKIRTLIYPWGKQHLYNCPGCKYEHAFSPNMHQYDGNADKPTISPSLLLSNPQNVHTCHSFVKNGFIQFLGDCWHELKNQTVELPDYGPEQELEIDMRKVWEE